MRVCVTGGLGLVASHILEKLSHDSIQILVIDNDSSRNHRVDKYSNIKVINANMGSTESLVALSDFRPNVLIHLAAQKDVMASIAEPELDAEINIIESLRLIKVALESNCETVIFASSGGALYDSRFPSPYSEKDKIQPESPYGVAKLALESYLFTFAKNYGTRTVNLRLANVYGASENRYGVIPLFFNRIKLGSEIDIYGDGMSVRDYVYCKDVAGAFIKAINSNISGTFNIGSGSGTNLLQLVEQMDNLLGTKTTKRFLPYRTGEIKESVLVVDKAKSILQWEPQTSLTKGLAETFEEWSRYV
jgi:UDP-glucose 4-epimerase